MYFGPPGNARHCFLRILPLLLLVTCVQVSGKRYKKPWFCDSKVDGNSKLRMSQQTNPMSFLWSVRRDPPAYFFGTIHVPYTRVWDFIPDGTKQAFEASDNVFFELDLLDPRTISGLASCQMLPKGKTLVDLLPQDMFRRLKIHLDYVKVMMPNWMTADQRGRGLYAEYLFQAITGNWERKRPVWVMLMVNALTESDVKSRGIPVLDLFLAQEAERLNKRTGAVERVEEQCLPLNGLNLSQVLFALNQTLVQHEGLRGTTSSHADGSAPSPTYTTDDLIKHYNCGDLNSVVFSQDTTQMPTLSSGNISGSDVGTPLTPTDATLAKDIDDYFRAELIYKRNRRMANRVVQLLKTYPDQSFFFAFGAGHYLGNDTVLTFIQQAGFQVDHVPPHKKFRGSKRSRENRKAAFSESSWMSTAGQMPDVRHQLSYPPGVYPATGTMFGQRPRLSLSFPRTTASPPPHARPPRKFNDLWVRIDTFSTREPNTNSKDGNWRPSLDQQQQHRNEVKAFEDSLRVWYGIPSTSSMSCPISPWSSLFLLVLLLHTRQYNTT